MFEKVNPSHPDKIADRIAGAIIDLAYKGKRKINRRHGKRPAFLPQYMCPQENRSFIF